MTAAYPKTAIDFIHYQISFQLYPTLSVLAITIQDSMVVRSHLFFNKVQIFLSSTI